MPSSSAAAARVDAAVRAAVGRPLAWVALLATLAAWPIAWSLRTRVPPPPPVLGDVAGFRLTDQEGRPFGTAELAGRVWVASFVFTRCEGDACPAIARAMGRVQARARNLEPALHLVSISVDPAFDTPARLAAFARAQRASPRMWTFLTGPDPSVRAAVEGGLGAAAGTDGAAPSPAGIAHGPRLVLVDGAARIRGSYDPRAPGAADQLVRDAALLVNGAR